MLTWINELFDQEILPEKRELLSRGLRRSLEQLLIDCQALYQSAARRCIATHPEDLGASSEKYSELLLDLHRGVLIKTLIEIAHCDRQWNQAEREVATIVLKHVWGVEVSNAALGKALQNVIEHSQMLKWQELLRPFKEMPVLKHDASELRSIILRLANLIAKADGQVLPAELTQLERLQREIDRELRPGHRRKHESQGTIALESEAAELVHSAEPSRGSQRDDGQTSGSKTVEPVVATPVADVQERSRMLEQGQRELAGLIGLESIKQDVSQLIDFLKVQAARKEHGLPTASVSFHAVFDGNPGTGKTTVARILGRILCGLGILDSGQTIEADRSGLVAQYAGQTGPRTNDRVDAALGGVLFVDEAYSLVSDQGEDAYGTEAIQTLLKRMEDDRERFVVVLAGYTQPMQRMLRSNPGLSSRFQRVYSFPDYTARELLRIFYAFCKQYHYQLPKPTRRRLVDGFQKLIDESDEHFGNGRTARNVFEKAIRNMSSRLVHVTPLTRELLTTIEPEDIDFSAA